MAGFLAGLMKSRGEKKVEKLKESGLGDAVGMVVQAKTGVPVNSMMGENSPLTQTGMPHDPNNMSAMNQPILDPLTGLPVQPTYANKGMMQQDVNKWKSPDSPLLKKNPDDKIEALNEKYDSGKISEQKYRKKLMKLHSKK